MKRFLIIIKKTKTGFSAYLPYVPGCIATAKTKSVVEKRIGEAIEFHIKGLRDKEILYQSLKAIRVS